MVTLNPRVDFAFKKLFGSEENKALLISFINAIVSEADRITDVKLLNPYNNKNHSLDKLSILDIRATDTQGRHFNIEIQVTDEVYYSQRALYYWSRIYANQLQSGEPYENLKKTISIHVLNFNYFDEPDYHNVFHLLNLKSHKRYFEDLELHFIELAKFDEELSPLKTSLDRWSNFLKCADRYGKNNVPKAIAADPAIKQAIEVLQHMDLNEEESTIYEARLKWWRDGVSAIRSAELRGLEEGLEKGREEGLEKGREEGETLASHRIALKLLQNGVSMEHVMQATDLPIEIIKLLAQDI